MQSAQRGDVADTFLKSETEILVLAVSPRFWLSGLTWTAPNTTTVNTDMFEFIVMLLEINVTAKKAKTSTCVLCVENNSRTDSGQKMWHHASQSQFFPTSVIL